MLTNKQEIAPLDKMSPCHRKNQNSKVLAINGNDIEWATQARLQNLRWVHIKEIDHHQPQNLLDEREDGEGGPEDLKVSGLAAIKSSWASLVLKEVRVC